MNKLPQITLLFWIIKICATTLGETAGDLLSMTLHVGYATSSIILLSVFATTLFLQLRAKTFHPVLYWTVILSTSTAGTTLSDFMDRTLQLGYATGSAILITLLLGVLGLWRWRQFPMSVTNIKTAPHECLYWAAILVSNTLGTALGDFLADDSGLGFAGGAILITGLLVVITAAKYWTSVSHTMLFWMAFILTRPWGATMGDVLMKTPEKGGLGFGTIGTSTILLTMLIGLVIINTRQRRTDYAATVAAARCAV